MKTATEVTGPQAQALELLAEDIRRHHKEVERNASAMVAAAIAAGKKLLEAKGGLKHGEFGPFLTYCGVSARSARVYMRLARNSADAAVLEADSIRAALDALAGPSRKRPAPPDLGPDAPRRSEAWQTARWVEAMVAQGRDRAEVAARAYSTPKPTDFAAASAIKRAIEHSCPDCGAKAGVRCRILTRTDRGPGYPVNTKVDVRPKPCPGRCALAWREMLNEEVTA